LAEADYISRFINVGTICLQLLNQLVVFREFTELDQNIPSTEHLLGDGLHLLRRDAILAIIVSAEVELRSCRGISDDGGSALGQQSSVALNLCVGSDNHNSVAETEHRGTQQGAEDERGNQFSLGCLLVILVLTSEFGAFDSSH
jgi:hypothetical protein